MKATLPSTLPGIYVLLLSGLCQYASCLALRGLRLPVPDGAVGHDVAAGALPLDLAAVELFLVQRRVYAIFGQQGAVSARLDHASGVDDVDDVGVDNGGQAMGDGDGGP